MVDLEKIKKTTKKKNYDGMLQLNAFVHGKYLKALEEKGISKTDFIRQSLIETFPDL